MKTYRLASGAQMPALGLGTWNSSPGEVGAAVNEAMSIGYRHFDCAMVYGNEAEIGSAFRAATSAGIASRENLWITSKLWNHSHRPELVRGALEKTLADLQLEYLDLYLIHWPVVLRDGVLYPESADDLVSLDEVPLVDTWKALEACVRDGLCRHIGVSNFSQKKLAHIIDHAEIKPAVNQIEAHPLLQQPALFEFCQTHDVLITAYSPLGSRGRDPKIKREDEPDLLGHPTIGSIAAAHQMTPAQVLIAWAIQRGTSVIPKSVNPSRLRENFAAADFELTSDEMQQIRNLDRHYRFLDGHFWVFEGAPYTVANLWDE